MKRSIEKQPKPKIPWRIEKERMKPLFGTLIESKKYFIGLELYVRTCACACECNKILFVYRTKWSEKFRCALDPDTRN